MDSIITADAVTVDDCDDSSRRVVDPSDISMESTTIFTTDTSSELCSRELAFLEKKESASSHDLKFAEFNNDQWWSKVATAQHFDSSETLSMILPKNVLYSRITKKHYVVKTNLSIEDLREAFESTGHTIAIDYRQSYVRYLAFDIDCACRKIINHANHNNLENVKIIAITLVRLLLSLRMIDLEDVDVREILETNDTQILQIMDEHCAIWMNSCGFHIYTSIPVSIPLHCYILSKLKAKIDENLCNIEIPTLMPLPYSAKTLGVPYKPAKNYQYTPSIVLSTQPTTMLEFHENLLILPPNVKSMGSIKAISVSMQESSGMNSQTLYYHSKLSKSKIIPVYPKYLMIGKSQHTPETEMLFNYINSMSKLVKTCIMELRLDDPSRGSSGSSSALMMTTNYDSSRNSNICGAGGSVVVDEQQNFMAHVDTKFENYRTTDYDYLVKSFMLTFNQNFIDQKIMDDEANYFINYALDFGCLYLQHAVVMLHYWMLEHLYSSEELPCERFIDKLTNVFTHDIIENSVCLKEFLKLYSDTVLYSYKSTSREMLNHFAFLKAYQINPFMDLTDTLLTIVEMRFGTDVEYCQKLGDKKKNERDVEHSRLFDFYCGVLIELGVVLHNSQTNTNFILVDNLYLVESTNNPCPDILTRYIRDGGAKYNSSAMIKNLLLKKKLLQHGTLFTTTEFQFQTNVGSFNSITGLYSAHCKFLRFSRKRNCAIWYNPFDNVFIQSEHQNIKCTQLQLWIRDFHSKIPEFVNKLYLDFIFIPAILQISLLPSIQEKNVGIMSKLLLDYDDLPLSASFIVEYYQIHPIYIYLITWIYTTYDGFVTLSDYTTLRNHAFQHKLVNNDDLFNDWYELLLPVAQNCTYNKNTKTHMEKLSSISDNKAIFNLDESFALKITIFTLLVSRCCSYKVFNSACAAICNTIINNDKNNDVKILLNIDKTKIDSQYVNLIEQLTNLSSKEDLIRIYRENLQTTKSRVFTNISKHEVPFDSKHIIRNRIIDTFIIICMSSFFDLETVKNLIECFSLLFVTKNVKKKLILFYGRGNVGKSAFCKMIKFMLEPFVGLFTNFQEASQRANVSTMYNGVILNEVCSVDGDVMKSHTGNDAESAVQFFSTVYENRETQALFYGATNKFIIFKKSKSNIIDRDTIDRLHVLELKGVQINADSSSVSDFLNMLVNNLVFKNTIVIDENSISSYAMCMAMLSFANYIQTRSPKEYIPALNTYIPSSIYYRTETFKANNKLYNFLLNLGFQREEMFYISKKELLRVVYKAIGRSKKLNNKSLIPYNSMDDFYIAFKQEFQVDLSVPDDAPIQGMQEYGLIQHIKDNLRVQKSIGSVITTKDVDDRVNYMFNSNKPDEFITNKDNAKFYMHRMNIDKYDSDRELYRDITFMQDTTSYLSFEDDSGNPINEILCMNSSSSSSNSNSGVVTPTEIRNNIVSSSEIDITTVDNIV